ncbi:MAG: hypothetical protein OER86_06830 [Phycisphaerae bacterium]|nr:hypothetical protein [Phycisphaerae bacterium]
MTDPTPTPGRSVAELERATTAMASRLNEYQAVQRRTRNIVLVFSAVIAVMVLAFGIATYNKVRQNFEAGKVRKQLMAAADEMRPDLMKLVNKVGDKAAPIYIEAAKEHFSKDEVMGPISQAMSAEAEKLPDDVVTEMLAQFQQVQDRIFQRLRPDMTEALPGLSTEAGQEQIARRIEQETQKIKDHLSAGVKRDRARIQEALVKLHDTPKIPEGVEMERQFVHLLLKWADHELMDTKPGKPGTTATVVVPETP